MTLQRPIISQPSRRTTLHLPTEPLAILCLVLLSVTLASCSLGEGVGHVYSDSLFVEECYQGKFDLNPDFFAAVPYRNTLTIRIQHGGDLEEVSDGLILLVDEVDTVQRNLGTPLTVGMPKGVAPVGVPIVYNPSPPLVHVSLYLNRSCHAQNSTLYSTAGTMTFNAIFDGDPNESDAQKRLTDAAFDITLADPRDLASDGTIPAEDTSVLTGAFRFYFQRGQPAQTFP